MANKIYYSTITYQSILRNDNWKQGGNASTFMSDTKDGKPLKMEVNQYGKTKKEAEEKLIKFLNGNGQTDIECVGNF